jgi:hypothetical protein
MKIYFDDAVSRDYRPRVEKIVAAALTGHRESGSLAVSIGRYGKDNWSVFVTGSLEHPLGLVETIRTALERERL